MIIHEKGDFQNIIDLQDSWSDLDGKRRFKSQSLFADTGLRLCQKRQTLIPMVFVFICDMKCSIIDPTMKNTYTPSIYNGKLYQNQNEKGQIKFT